jgi:hypothetical protein
MKNVILVAVLTFLGSVVIPVWADPPATLSANNQGPTSQPSITASKPTFVAWKAIKETYGVQARSLANVMEEDGQ